MLTKSEMLLGRLIEERLVPGVDVAEVDRRLRTFFEEEWCVVSTRMAGAQAADAANGIPFLCLVHELRRMTRPVLEAHGGFVIKSIADRSLVLFRRAPDALQALIAAHRALVGYNESHGTDQRIQLATAIAFGRVLRIGDEDVFGLEVNHAMQLGESLARATEILLTDSARAALLHLPGVVFEDAHLSTPFPAFRARYDLSPR